MTFLQYLEGVGAKNYLASFYKDGKIEEWADLTNKKIHEAFGDDSKDVTAALAMVCFAFGRFLLKGDLNGTRKALSEAGIGSGTV